MNIETDGVSSANSVSLTKIPQFIVRQCFSEISWGQRSDWCKAEAQLWYTPHVGLHHSGSCWKTDSRSAERDVMLKPLHWWHYPIKRVCSDQGLVCEQRSWARALPNTHTHTKHKSSVHWGICERTQREEQRKSFGLKLVRDTFCLVHTHHTHHTHQLQPQPLNTCLLLQMINLEKFNFKY